MQEIIEEIKKQINELMKKVEELEKEKEDRGVWNPEKGDIYYWLYGDGHITNDTWANDETDSMHYELGNCFKTEEEAEKVKRHLITRAKLQRIADRLNAGREINWKNGSQRKYTLNYNYADYCIDDDYSYTLKNQGSIYCLDENFKDIAIKEIGDKELTEYLKGV